MFLVVVIIIIITILDLLLLSSLSCIINIKYSPLFYTRWPAIIFNTLQLLSCLYDQLPAPYVHVEQSAHVYSVSV